MAEEVLVEVVGIYEHEVGFGEQERLIAVALLRDAAGRELRVPISSCEAFAVQLALTEHHVPRPLTHDLALRLIESLSARLERVVVDEITDDYVHATLYLQASGGKITIDARPGDAIALALRANVPVMVNEDLL